MELKSISVNSVFDKKTVKENLNKDLIQISGFVQSSFDITTKYGEQPGFKGDFIAVNLFTGEVFESNAAFLPKGLTRDINKQLEKAAGQEIQFKAVIRAIESDKNDRGYAWVAEAPVTEARLNRRAAMLKEAQNDAQKLLTAPKKEAKK